MQFLLHKIAGHAHKGKVPSKETHKARPDGNIGLEGEPQDTAQDHGPKIGGPKGKDDRSALAFDLSWKIIGPRTAKGFKEPHQNHDKVDVKVDHVQEAKASINAVEQGE